jgi:AcrR family transcriptional regulator
VLDAPQIEGEGSHSARRVPVQYRSVRTVKRVLDAASSLLERMPLEDVTTTRIATEAGLSIGALYRFFPDKRTIVDAIAVRHIVQFRSLPASLTTRNIRTADPRGTRPGDRGDEAHVVELFVPC